jgi:hypothetical protein
MGLRSWQNLVARKNNKINYLIAEETHQEVKK